MLKPTATAALASLLLLTGISPAEAQIVEPRPRVILQVGGNITLPVGELASTGLENSGFATTSVGFQARGCYSLTRKLALFAGMVNPRFGYDRLAIEDISGDDVGDAVQRFSILNAGLRLVLSDNGERISYFQAGLGRYRFEDDPAVEGLPLEAEDDPFFGYCIGAGIMNRHLGLGLDMTFEYHSSRVLFLNGIEIDANWLTASIMIGIPLGEVR